MTGETTQQPVAPLSARSMSPVLQLAANIWFFLLLAYLVVMPAGLLHFGVPLLGLTGACGVLIWLFLSRHALTDVRTVILGFALAGAIPVGLGILASTPGWRDVAVPLVGGPLLWYFVSHLPDRTAIRWIPTALAVGTIVLAVIALLLVNRIWIDQIQLLSSAANGFVVDGEARVNFPGISSLIATVPFLAVLVIDEFRFGKSLRHRRLVLLGLVAGLVAALMSGRQGVVGTIALTPIFMLVTSAIGFRIAPKANRSGAHLKVAVAALAVVVVGVGISAQLGLEPSRIPTNLLAAVGLTEEEGNARVERGSLVRSTQGSSLLDGWLDKPLAGNGGGAVAQDFYTWRGYEIGTSFKDVPRPWRAELAYHLLLFESGLLGLAAFATATIVAVRRLRRQFVLRDECDQTVFRAAVVAALSIAAATAVNPIARAVGHQLMLFLPVIVMAATVRRMSNNGAEHHADSTTDAAVVASLESP